MNLSERVAFICRQPESVRMRYVWLCVSVSMFFVLVIWFLSLEINFKQMRGASPRTTPAAADSPEKPSLDQLLQPGASH